MHEEILDGEKNQLLNCWIKISNSANSGALLTGSSLNYLSKLSELNKIDSKKIDSCLRQFHDKLGFKAKGSLKEKGLCSGAIFRTEKFILTNDRRGSRIDQSIHIEHTIPINCLRNKLVELKLKNNSEIFSWLLKYSIATAFSEDEKIYLTGVERSSNVFIAASNEYNLPFKRYNKLFAAGHKVFNVFDGVQINENTTIDYCYDVLIRLIISAGFEEKVVELLKLNYT